MMRIAIVSALVLGACTSESDPTSGGVDAGADHDMTTGSGASGGSGAGPSSGGGGTGGTSASGGSAGSGGVEDPTFSFVVIPDTQVEVLNDNNAQNHFNHRIDWILANREAKDIRFALQTGDLCNWDTPTHDQYVRASSGLQGFDDAGFPYALAIGNHDAAATCPGGSACPGDTNALLRDTSTFNSFFPTTRFPTMVETFEVDKVDNAYHLFHAGGVDWIVIAMELWARADAYQWVGKVLADHPRHNGIVFTHSHLTGGGNIKGDNGGYGDTSPKKIFDEVLSQHENLRFVFNGHEGLVAFRQDTGAKGNSIYQFLFNEDDATNPTRVVTIDTAAKTIDSYVYGPATDKTYDDSGATVNLTNVDFVD